MPALYLKDYLTRALYRRESCKESCLQSKIGRQASGGEASHHYLLHLFRLLNLPLDAGTGHSILRSKRGVKALIKNYKRIGSKSLMGGDWRELNGEERRDGDS